MYKNSALLAEIGGGVDTGLSLSHHCSLLLDQDEFPVRELRTFSKTADRSPAVNTPLLTLDFLRPSTRWYLQQALISTAPMVYCAHRFASIYRPRRADTDTDRENGSYVIEYFSRWRYR